MDSAQYAAAAHIPFIKSPSLRIPRPIVAPPDIHPLPDDINAYFVYPFTLEPHILTLESSRRTTLAAHAAKHAAVLKQREEDKERRRREALRRVAPGFEPQGAPLIPVRVQNSNTEANNKSGESGGANNNNNGPQSTTGEGGADKANAPGGHARQRSVMDDLVDHLAALDAAQNNESRMKETSQA